jgi:hypothetical protein
MHQKDPSVFVSGNIAIPPSSVQADCTFNSTGSQSFTGTTDANGVLTVSSVAIGTNCAWSLFRNTSNLCPTQNLVTRIFDVPGKNFELQCGSEVNTFLASPNKVDPTAPPATITITGQNMDPTYAMPRVYFYDQNQTVWLQVTATSASADGTQIVIPASQVTFPDTYYAAVVFVLRANGSWDAVGGAAVRVFTPISPPPGGGGGCTGRNCLPQC